MQLVLHMLDSINTNLSSIQGIDYDGFIAAQRKKLESATTFFEDAFDQVAQRLKSIPRARKAESQIQYHVRVSESDSG